MICGHAIFLLPFLTYLLISSSTAVQIATKGSLDAPSFANGDKHQPSDKISTSLRREDDFLTNETGKIRDVLTVAMKVPEKREQIGQVLPIIRNMSGPQKLALASLVSSRISSNESLTLPYDEAHSFLGGGDARTNATRELMLPISMDIAKILTEEENLEELPEELPEAQELRLLVRPGRGRRPYFRPPPPPRTSSGFNRRNVYSAEGSRVSTKRPGRRPTKSATREEPSGDECTFFSKTVCLEVANYPHEAIMRSIRGNKEMVAALLTDYKSEDDPENLRNRPSALPLENRFENNEIRRRSDYPSPFDNVEEGFTCPSNVMYARPQLARAVSGIWKYIINTGEHTQTLRLEKCSKPKASCSFISENYRSSCIQVYNYHRLLTWEASLGLHMDIFKVPTCCSCHVHGYAELFPPIQKDPRPSHHESFPGAEFATEDEASNPPEYSERPSSYLTKFKPSSLDTNFLSSSKKPLADAGTANRPSYALPGRRKKPTSPPRPFDKLPQQHAPNTRAPGYKGPIIKSKRPARPSRPYRRESSADLDDNASSSIESSTGNLSNWSSQLYDQDMDASTRLHNGGFDEEYQEPNRRVNYNYHPIIDFFKPEASMLQSPEPQLATQSSTPEQQANSDSWKPMIAT
ncbi:neurotrophin 1 [Venturia canescens]|uniref:neurotrophin 1 n=1 Tax=Venturia canescens TaxID=32260 RepID=UPI001C9C69B0|nr:neurotrophin 1 [Venturia canescens]